MTSNNWFTEFLEDHLKTGNFSSLKEALDARPTIRFKNSKDLLRFATQLSKSREHYWCAIDCPAYEFRYHLYPSAIRYLFKFDPHSLRHVPNGMNDGLSIVKKQIEHDRKIANNRLDKELAAIEILANGPGLNQETVAF